MTTHLYEKLLVSVSRHCIAAVIALGTHVGFAQRVIAQI
jgi:hypothetical protein